MTEESSPLITKRYIRKLEVYKLPTAPTTGVKIINYYDFKKGRHGRNHSNSDVSLKIVAHE